MKFYPYGVGSLVTRVIEDGAGDNAMVLVHGAGARCDRWRHNIPVFAKAGYHVYALDMPGHGFASKGPNFAYGAPGFAGFVADFIRSLPHKKVILVGTSLGGHTSATVGYRHPELIRALILVGATGLFELGPEVRNAISERVKDLTRQGIVGKLNGLVYDAKRLVTGEWVDEEFRINNSPGAAEAFAKLSEWFRQSVDKDAIGDKLGSMPNKPPILLIWGVADRAVPVEVGRKAKTVLGNPPLVEMQEAAHAPYLEKPDEFNRAVLDFAKTIK